MTRVLFSIAVVAAFTLFPVILTAGQGVSCASLVVIDGDTIKCDGQNMRLLGGGVPFKSGLDAPEMGSRAKCDYERDLALKAKARLKELLLAGVPRIEDSGTRDRTPSRWPLVNVYLSDGREAEQVLCRKGWRENGAQSTALIGAIDLCLPRSPGRPPQHVTSTVEGFVIRRFQLSVSK